MDKTDKVMRCQKYRKERTADKNVHISDLFHSPNHLILNICLLYSLQYGKNVDCGIFKSKTVRIDGELVTEIALYSDRIETKSIRQISL